MSVILPDGNGNLNFRFEPKQFLTLFNISNHMLVFLFILIVISLGKIFYEKRKN